MPRTIKTSTAISLAVSAVCGLLYWFWRYEIFLTLSITFGTIFYHLGIRLAVGWCYQRFMGNHADCSRRWYQLRSWESRLYQKLNVKRWKNKMPTYQPESFSPKLHSWDEIAQAMCQSELVHETNIPLSFFPLIAAQWFGSLEVFFMTSILAAAFDLMFVIVQRYNRPRILKLALRMDRKQSGTAV